MGDSENVLWVVLFVTGNLRERYGEFVEFVSLGRRGSSVVT